MTSTLVDSFNLKKVLNVLMMFTSKIKLINGISPIVRPIWTKEVKRIE